jgi:SnoaL-like domain
MSDLQNLEKRLKILEDERAIQTTLFEYGHSIDYGLKEKFAGLFTEDAVYQVAMRGVAIPSLGSVSQGPNGIKGRDVILQYVKGHTNAPNMWHKHFMVEPVIRFEDQDHATVESYFARLDEDAKGAYIIAFGRYRDRMVRCPDGKWRFSERICEMESRPPVR